MEMEQHQHSDDEHQNGFAPPNHGLASKQKRSEGDQSLGKGAQNGDQRVGKEFRRVQKMLDLASLQCECGMNCAVGGGEGNFAVLAEGGYSRS